MDSRNLSTSIDFVGSSGIILSPEQKATLYASLVILKSNQKCKHVYFWGKILGTKDDYYVAQGVQSDVLAKKTTFYSKDCIHWGLLTMPNAETIQKAKLMTGRFTGDPSHECQHRESTRVIANGAETEEEHLTTMTEEDRLAAVIASIDHDVSIVPRGAFVKTPTGQVYQNRSFEGLSVAEAAKLCNYLHMRTAETLNQKTLLQRSNLDKSIDFMDSLEDDVPRGVSWSLQLERGAELVTLRSLLWLGYVFYHVPESRYFGSIYVGTGERNIDLPFML